MCIRDRTDIVNSGGTTVIFPKGTTIYGYSVFGNASLPNSNNCSNCNVTFSNSKMLWGINSSITMWKNIGQCYDNQPGYTSVCGTYSYYNSYDTNNLYEIPNIYSVAESTTINLSVTTQQSLNKDANIEFRIKQKNLSAVNYTAKFNTRGSLKIKSVSNQIDQLPSATTGSTGFIDSVQPTSGSVTSSITLNNQLTSFLGYTFIPSPPTGSSATQHSLYPTYGDVDYKFELGYYDMIVHHDVSGSVSEYRIINTRISNDAKLVIDIYPAFDNDDKARDFEDPSKYTKILFLKRLKEETNTIINFIKRDGKTSYGFIIPNNLHPDVFANIDTITREVKSKMIEGGGLDGGTL
jgi:hypothetical protein